MKLLNNIRGGFTLIELIFLVVIIGIILSTIIPAIGSISESRDNLVPSTGQTQSKNTDDKTQWD